MSAETQGAETRTGEARLNGPQPLTLDERTKIGEHLLSLLVLDAKFDRQRDLIVTWFRRYEATVAAVERERDEARRALDFYAAPENWRARALYGQSTVAVDYHPSSVHMDGGKIARAALTARPAETPEGR